MRQYHRTVLDKGEELSAVIPDELVWILKKEENNSWKPTGPYYGKELIGFLQSGFCSDKDFIWKPGFKEWKRISLVKGLSAHPGHVMEDILIQQGRKYQVQRPRNVRYLPSHSITWWT